MTREEFLNTWQPAPGLSRAAFVAQIDALLSATRKAALDEAWKIADSHECVPMGGCRCGTHIMDEIQKAKEKV